jgi:hypothetical protein
LYIFVVVVKASGWQSDLAVTQDEHNQQVSVFTLQSNRIASHRSPFRLDDFFRFTRSLNGKVGRITKVSGV